MTGKLYRPASLVTDVCLPLVAMSVRITLAPGTTPPCGSVTSPEILPDEAVCADAEVTASVHNTATETTHPTKNASFFICDPPRNKTAVLPGCCAGTEPAASWTDKTKLKS